MSPITGKIVPSTTQPPDPARRGKTHANETLIAQNVPTDIGKSNRIYSADEQVYISSLLTHAIAQQNQVSFRIANLERQKQDIMTRLQILQDEDDDIRSEIDRYRIALALYKRLPDDVLSEIFAWCVFDDLAVDIPFRYTEEQGSQEIWQNGFDYHADTDDNPESSEGSCECSVVKTGSDWSTWSFDEEPRMDFPLPLILSQICSAWRRVALSTPLLWSSVSITSFTLRTKRLATEWLSRARGFPVSITIYGTAVDSDEFDLFAELKDFLSEYHIKALDLPLYSERCAQILSELSADNISQLERLSLVDIGYCQERIVLLEGTRLPHLRDLELVGNFKFNNFGFPWTSLRSLDMSFCHLPATDCLDIMRQCKSLQTCSLGISALPELPPTIEQSIHMPALYDLAVAFHVGYAHVGIFLQHLTIPRLATLAISGIESRQPLYIKWSDRDFYAMIGRSNCPLSHLTIEKTQEPIDVGTLLASIPGLRLLTLDQANFDQDTVDRLAQGQLGPDLEHFTVRETDGVSLHQLRDMIERRANPEHNAVVPFITFSIPEEVDGASELLFFNM